MIEFRKLADHKNVDIFMICVSKDQETSLASVTNWIQEIREKDQGKPIILIMTKTDLSEEECLNPVTLDQLKATQKNHGLQGIYQASSKAKDNSVYKAFMYAIMAAREHKMATKFPLLNMKAKTKN